MWTIRVAALSLVGLLGVACADSATRVVGDVPDRQRLGGDAGPREIRAQPGANQQAQITGRDPAAESTKRNQETIRQDPKDKFAIYTSDLSGENRKLIASDPKREINHARVSPDHKHVVFTRYNTFGFWSGEALEANGYDQSEAIVCRIDGQGCESVLPARKGIISANAYWAPDGKSLIYFSTDTPDRSPVIKRLSLVTRQIDVLYKAPDLLLGDPHQVGHQMVVVGIEKKGPLLPKLYLIDTTNQTRRQLTNPMYAKFVSMHPPLGDYDPKLSEDGSKVAVMRRIDTNEWHIVIVDVASGAEKTLTKPKAVDAVPEWSSDGQLLIYWHADPAVLKNSGLYTIRPDGSERKRIALPSGSFYTMPAFFPRTGSGPNARIIYSRKLDSNF